MSTPELYGFLIEELTHAFGTPQQLQGDKHFWGLSCVGLIPMINVFSGNSGRIPAVWVFDPHHPEQTVLCVEIENPAQVDPLIELIRMRVRRSGDGHGDTPQSR